MSSPHDSEDEPPPSISLRHVFKEGVKLCPRCLSPVRIASSISGWLTPDEYLCEACGYSGPVAIEPTKEFLDQIDDLQEETKH